MKNQQIFIFSAFLMLAAACFNDDNQKVIASVHEKDLLLSEVIKEMPQATEDSSFFVEHYMNLWIRKQLLIYAYQQELINQNFDTTIALEAVTDYYNQYKEEFKLNKNIFLGRYIVVDKSAPRLSKLSKWYKSDKQEYIVELEDYCQQFAKEYYLADSNWQYFSVINNKLPKIIKEEDVFLKNIKGVYFEDNQFLYYIYIKDYKIKGSISPLAFEKEKIRNVLLNKNKIKYLKQLEDELFQNDIALKKIKIY